MSGKDQFCNYCMNYMSNNGIFGGIISTVDLVKDIATQLGWDGVKTPKDRKFLSDLKKLLTDWNNVPFTYVQNQIRQTYLRYTQQMGIPQNHIIFFVMCREKEEIEKFKETYGAITLVVRREDMEKMEQSNASDSEVLNIDYDYVIHNDKGLEELENEAVKFMREIIKF